MMYIHNYSTFISRPLDDLAVYKREISRHTGLKFRRANKFVLLSLAGACRCVHGQALKTDTAVFLTTENGTMADTETVLEQIYDKHEFPLPYNFINTMSNTAAFYVSQTLEILGRSFTISSQQFSFERGLELLRCDLDAGVVTRALFGGVDEACFSMARFESRFNRPHGEHRLVEGSCWLLIAADSDGALGEIRSLESFNGLTPTAAWVKRGYSNKPLVLSYGILVDPSEKKIIADAAPHGVEFDYISEYGYFDSATACGICGFLDRYANARLVHINKDFHGQYVVLAVEKY